MNTFKKIITCAVLLSQFLPITTFAFQEKTSSLNTQIDTTNNSITVYTNDIAILKSSMTNTSVAKNAQALILAKKTELDGYEATLKDTYDEYYAEDKNEYEWNKLAVEMATVTSTDSIKNVIPKAIEYAKANTLKVVTTTGLVFIVVGGVVFCPETFALYTPRPVCVS